MRILEVIIEEPIAEESSTGVTTFVVTPNDPFRSVKFIVNNFLPRGGKLIGFYIDESGEVEYTFRHLRGGDKILERQLSTFEDRS